MPKKASKEEALEAQEVLAAEFNYIAQSAFQTNEDRARVASYYLVSVGSFIAAMASTSFEDKINIELINAAFAVLFVILFVDGVLTLLQLVRLRLAWMESARAMNQMKEYLIKRYASAKFEELFRWREKTLPLPYKSSSVSYLMALQVAILSGATLAAAVVFIGFAIGQDLIWPASILAGSFAGWLLMWIYKRGLSQ